MAYAESSFLAGLRLWGFKKLGLRLRSLAAYISPSYL